MKKLLLLFALIAFSIGVQAQRIEDLPRALTSTGTDLIIIDQSDSTRAIAITALYPLGDVQNTIWVSKDNDTGYEDGTMFFPYDSIQDGLDAASEGFSVIVLQPADDSPYREHLVMSTDSVRLMSLEGYFVKVELQSSGGMGMDFDSDYLVVGGGSGMGFTFTCDAGLMMVFDADRTGVEISHNTIVVDDGGTIGINVGASGSTDLKVKNNLFRVSDGQGAFYAVKSLKNVEISGNEFVVRKDASSGYAIQMSGFLNGVIKDNYIHADTTGIPTGASGIFPHTATSGPHASDSLHIFNNVVMDMGNGIRLGHSTQTVDMKALFIYGNTIQYNTDGIEIADDAQVYPATYDIYNNTLSDNTNHVNTAHATPANYGMNTFDALVSINGLNPSEELEITGDLELTSLATATTTVLTPTATGKIDTLETSDITETTLDTLDVDYIEANSKILAGDGTVSLPSFAFISDPNTGMYDIGADILGLSIGGVEGLRITETGSSVFLSTSGPFDQTITNTGAGGDRGINTYLSQTTNALTGQLVGIKSSARINVASAAGTVRGGWFAAGNMDAGYALSTATGVFAEVTNKIPSGGVTWTNARGVEVNMDLNQGSAGNVNTITNAYMLYGVYNLPTVGTYSTVTNGYGVFLRNEQVGGDGQLLDAAFYVDDLNMGGAVHGWDYGIDFSGIGSNSGNFGTADIRLANSATIDNTDADTLELTETIVKVSGDLVVTGVVSHRSATAYVSTPGTQTIGTGGTFERLNEGAIAYTAAHLDDFTHDDGRLTYTGTPTDEFTIIIHANIESDEAAALVSIRLAVNGSTVAATNMQHDYTAVDTDAIIALSWLLDMATNDYIEVFGTSDTNGDTFEVHNLIITIK